MVPVEAPLLGMPAGTRGFRLKAKPEVVVEVVVVVVVELVVEAPGATPGALRLKPSVPAPGATVVVAGAERESAVAVEEGAAAMEEKSEGPTLAVVVGAAAVDGVAPVVVAAGVDGVKGKPESAVG